MDGLCHRRTPIPPAIDGLPLRSPAIRCPLEPVDAFIALVGHDLPGKQLAQTTLDGFAGITSVALTCLHSAVKRIRPDLMDCGGAAVAFISILPVFVLLLLRPIPTYVVEVLVERFAPRFPSSDLRSCPYFFQVSEAFTPSRQYTYENFVALFWHGLWQIRHSSGRDTYLCFLCSPRRNLVVPSTWEGFHESHSPLPLNHLPRTPPSAALSLPGDERLLKPTIWGCVGLSLPGLSSAYIYLLVVGFSIRRGNAIWHYLRSSSSAHVQASFFLRLSIAFCAIDASFWLGLSIALPAVGVTLQEALRASSDFHQSLCAANSELHAAMQIAALGLHQALQATSAFSVLKLFLHTCDCWSLHLPPFLASADMEDSYIDLNAHYSPLCDSTVASTQDEDLESLLRPDYLPPTASLIANLPESDTASNSPAFSQQICHANGSPFQPLPRATVASASVPVDHSPFQSLRNVATGLASKDPVALKRAPMDKSTLGTPIDIASAPTSKARVASQRYDQHGQWQSMYWKSCRKGPIFWHSQQYSLNDLLCEFVSTLKLLHRVSISKLGKESSHKIKAISRLNVSQDHSCYTDSMKEATKVCS